MHTILNSEHDVGVASQNESLEQGSGEARGGKATISDCGANLLVVADEDELVSAEADRDDGLGFHGSARLVDEDEAE